ncbi:twin arginine translocase protein A [compost metagenome]
MMGDFGKGVSSFKKGLSETEDVIKPTAQISPPPPAPPAESVRTPEEEAAARRDPGG